MTNHSQPSNEKTPEGAFSETLRLNCTDSIAQIRQLLLDLLTEYQHMKKPANPELLKLHIEAYEDRFQALLTAERTRIKAAALTDQIDELEEIQEQALYYFATTKNYDMQLIANHCYKRIEELDQARTNIQEIV